MLAPLLVLAAAALWPKAAIKTGTAAIVGAKFLGDKNKIHELEDLGLNKSLYKKLKLDENLDHLCLDFKDPALIDWSYTYVLTKHEIGRLRDAMELHENIMKGLVDPTMQVHPFVVRDEMKALSDARMKDSKIKAMIAAKIKSLKS